MSARSPLFCNRYRSEEHTSELQSQSNLVCRLLLEKKKQDVYEDVNHMGQRNILAELDVPDPLDGEPDNCIDDGEICEHVSEQDAVSMTHRVISRQGSN